MPMIGPGVVDDLSRRAGTDYDHRMPRRRLTELSIEEQIAGERRARIAADKICVPLDQCFGVGELSECAVGNVTRLESAVPHAKERRAERRVRIAPGANLARQCRNFDLASLEPAFIVALEGLAIGVAKQAGAIGDLRRDLGWETDSLVLGDERKPASECSLVCVIGQ